MSNPAAFSVIPNLDALAIADKADPNILIPVQATLADWTLILVFLRASIDNGKILKDLPEITATSFVKVLEDAIRNQLLYGNPKGKQQ